MAFPPQKGKRICTQLLKGPPDPLLRVLAVLGGFLEEVSPKLNPQGCQVELPNGEVLPGRCNTVNKGREVRSFL